MSEGADTPATGILSSLVGTVITALATTCWQYRGQQAGFVCALILAPSAIGFYNLIAIEHPRFAGRRVLARAAVVLAFLSYLLFFDETWVLISSVSAYLLRPVAVGWVFVGALGGFSLAALFLNLEVRARIGHVTRSLFARIARSSGNWLHRLAAAADRSSEGSELVELLRSTERVSQVSPKVPPTGHNLGA